MRPPACCREITLRLSGADDRPAISATDGPRRPWPSVTGAASNAEIAYTPTNASWWNRIEAQFTALRYFALDGTDHASHQEQASVLRRRIMWRNNHAYDERLRRIVDRPNVT